MVKSLALETGEKTGYIPQNKRKILAIFPKYSQSFGTFHHAYPLMGSKVKALMPPQGILVAIAYYLREWDVRFIDF
ncbi:MAG: hypothetical protein QNJ38_11900 [Prochloraceae cyanobacterium]|nr:hypothetical protein [Prochloraceae cyanobacterium]